MSGAAPGFYPPQVAGAGATVGQTGLPFRIDHDEKFNQTAHVQYTLKRGKFVNGLWGGFNRRYDSVLVSGQAPFAADTTTPVDLHGLTNDQHQEGAIACNGVKATRTAPLPASAPAHLSSPLIS